MKTPIAFLLASLMVGVVCAGQRLSDIQPGIPCTEIPEIEKRLGSSESPVHDATANRQYAGTQGNEKATIVYRCDKGRLTEQKILVFSRTRDEAYRFANEQKMQLIKRLGEPVFDGLELATWKKLLYGFLGADLDYLTTVVIWGREDEDLMLKISETGGRQWTVTISQGSSKMEYILNT